MLHEAFISQICLFKIHVTVAWSNYSMFQTKRKANLMQYYIFYHENKCDATFYVSLVSLYYDKDSTNFLKSRLDLSMNICPKHRKDKRYLSQKQIKVFAKMC